MEQDTNNQNNRVYEHLNAIAPDKTPPVKVARARLNQKIAEKEQNMWQKIFARKFRPIWATLAIITVLAFTFSFPQVRALATNFLGLFRVEKIEAVEVGISLDDLSSEMESNFIAIDNLIGDQIEVQQIGDPVPVADVAEAEALAGYKVRIPTELADKEQRIVFQPASTISFTIDRDRWQAMIDSMGYGDQFDIPKAADGAEVKFNLPNTVVIGFGECDVNDAQDMEDAGLPGSCTILMQTEQPTIEAPPGIDINQAGQVVLQILGMSPSEAEAFSNRVDWATTLVVPVPQGADYRSVMVDGAEGVILEDTYAGGNARFTMLWVKDGMFYALSGDGTRYSPTRIGNSLE
jgi:hypothetical protein